MLILTIVLVGFGGWLVTGWVLDEIAEARLPRAPKPARSKHRRPALAARAAAAFAAGWRDLAHAHALLKGEPLW